MTSIDWEETTKDIDFYC